MREMDRLREDSGQARRLAEMVTAPVVKQTLIDYAIDKEQRLAVLQALQKQPEDLGGRGRR